MKHKKHTIRKKRHGGKTRKMIGCSKRCNVCHKRHRGRVCSCKKGGFSFGGGLMDMAYTGKPIQTVPNPHLAYTGKGKGGGYTPLINRFPNYQQGGTCGPMCGGQTGGGCNCAQTGGTGAPTEAALIGKGLIPNGLTGQPWTATNWPGSTNISGNNNHYSLNKYIQDPQTIGVIDERTTSNLIPKLLLKGGSKKRKHRAMRRSKRAGGLLPQDLVNLGRSIYWNGASSQNIMDGYKPPANPLPWNDQYSGKYDKY